MAMRDRAGIALTIGVVAGACTFGFGLAAGAFGFGAAAVANALVTSALVGMFCGLSALLPPRRAILIPRHHHHSTVPTPHVHFAPSTRPAARTSWFPSSWGAAPSSRARTQYAGSHGAAHVHTPSAPSHASTPHAASARGNRMGRSTQIHRGSHDTVHVSGPRPGKH